ncbi:MAG: alpha/beta fold hydrolase [Cyclobacteriaceae bacterium]
MKNNYFYISILIIAGLLACSKDQSKPLIFEKLTYYQPEGFQDSVLTGVLEVFENRDESKGRKIPLFIAVTPALKRDSLKEPIFIIDGGPGVAVSNQAYFFTEEDDTYRQYHDIVYIDARGTGRSRPLHCIEIQTKRSPAEHFEKGYPEDEVLSCVEALKDSVDFNYYGTRYIVEDIEEVRQWLGYEKINIYGISFGGKVSLMFVDRYPEVVNRVVLHAPDAPNIAYTVNRGKWSEQSLKKVFDYCLKDSLCSSNFPEIIREFDALKNRLQTNQIITEVQFNDLTITLNMLWFPVAAKISSYLYDDYTYSQLPFIIHEAYLENYDPLLGMFNLQDTSTTYLFADGMFLSNICAEEIPHAEPVADELKTFLGDYTYRIRKEACDNWPVTPVDRSMYLPVKSDVPTLIISGGFDPTFSLETGAEIASTLSNSRRVIIPYMGHMLGNLSHLECYDQNVLRYFDGAELDVDCFNEMLPASFMISQVEDSGK